MDSLSQIALGAAVADLTLGARIGRRALLLGAALGTLPDLDVLVPYADAIDSFTLHRSFSHSLFVLSLVSVPIAALVQRLMPVADGVQVAFGRWWLACWAVLVTHPLLDGFTIYGTQLFWPIPLPPVAIGSIFIIDPLYTLPLLFGIALAWRYRHRLQRAHAAGLALSCTWLLLMLLAQRAALSDARESLQAEAVEPDRLIAVPLPFGVLWRVLALDGDDVLEGWSSFLDGRSGVDFERVPLGLAELGSARNLAAVQRLDWFTGGFVSARVQADELILTDLRIGTSAQPIFSFSVADVQPADGAVHAGPVYRARLAVARDPVVEPALFTRLLSRVRDADTVLDTATPAGDLPNAELARDRLVQP